MESTVISPYRGIYRLHEITTSTGVQPESYDDCRLVCGCMLTSNGGYCTVHGIRFGAHQLTKSIFITFKGYYRSSNYDRGNNYGGGRNSYGGGYGGRRSGGGGYKERNFDAPKGLFEFTHIVKE